MSVAKRAEIFRGIKDERWSTKDKLDQYRGILKLHGREKKLKSQDSVKLKKRISWQLGSFREDAKKYRHILNGLTNGVSKSSTHSLLLSRKDLQLKCRGCETEHIYGSVYEENHQKRRQLDRLRFEKRRKMKQCFQLQLEHAELYNNYTQEQHVPSSRDQTLQQQLVARYQQSIAKQNAAKAINLTYASMLEILKKDSMYHESLLNALKQDQRNQCEVMVKVTTVGQQAAEQSDDIEEKYRRVARNVWKNMKERERTLAIVRDQVVDLWSYAQSLIRTESETMFTMEITRGATVSNPTLDKQIRSMEEVFDKVKESLLVRSYRELFSRLEEQMKQRTRLLEQFDRNVKERNSLLNKKNDALLTLSSAEHSLVAGAEEYNAERNTLLEQIMLQKTRELEHETSRKNRGELLMDVRAALQSTVAMLVCVKRGSKIVKKQEKRATREEKLEATEAEEELMPVMEKMETEGEETELMSKRSGKVTVKNGNRLVALKSLGGLALLSTVGRKIGALFGMSNFEFDNDREARARDLYQTYVSEYHSRLKFHDAGQEPTGLFVEHEAVDSSVPTRAEIKLKSKQAVESYLRPE